MAELVPPKNKNVFRFHKLKNARIGGARHGADHFVTQQLPYPDSRRQCMGGG
jgi:hypothetical protein